MEKAIYGDCRDSLFPGNLLIGEDMNGNADAQMISMAGVDTLILKDILKNSGLPALQDPVAFLHTGNQGEDYMQVWVLSESGSYYLDRKPYRDPKRLYSKIFYRNLMMNLWFLL